VSVMSLVCEGFDHACIRFSLFHWLRYALSHLPPLSLGRGEVEIFKGVFFR